MNINLDQIFSQIRPLAKLGGIALVFVALAKLFGADVGIGGDAGAYALVGLGLLHI